VNVLAAEARQIAAALLGTALPRRWAHVQGVGTKAEAIRGFFEPLDADALVAAAWLHDVGYVDALAASGFHPLDGARWLRSQRFDERATRLVAHHSGALVEARLRGLEGVLVSEFSPEESPESDALWYCDLTTGPDGQDFDVLERLAEIRSRYGPKHLVTRFVDLAEDRLVASVRRTERRLAERLPAQPM
jgi:hypothetical protein